MAPPAIISAFISLAPLEPVLIFANANDAARFQSVCRQGRILDDQNSRWVFLPMPTGLLRVRTARGGDVAFEFDRHVNADIFNQSLKDLGRIYDNTAFKPHWDRTVYLGRILK